MHAPLLNFSQRRLGTGYGNLSYRRVCCVMQYVALIRLGALKLNLLGSSACRMICCEIHSNLCVIFQLCSPRIYPRHLLIVVRGQFHEHTHAGPLLLARLTHFINRILSHFGG